MELFHYVDRASPLGKLERTPQGGYRVPGTIARVGVMKYSAGSLRRQGVPLAASFADSDMVRIYQGPEVLKAVADTFSPGELPVTREHPPRFVTPSTFRESARGTVTAMTFDGKQLVGTLAIQDGELLGDVEMNVRRGVSPGYMASTVFEAGKTEDGQEYDGYRVRLEYNHAAVVKDPRGGAEVCLALDSDEIPADEVPVKLKIKGVEVDADKAQAAIDSLEGELAGVTARCEKAQADLSRATSPEAVQKYVADALEAAEKERAAKEAAEKAAQLKTEKVQKLKGFYGDSFSAEGFSDDYIDGLLKGVEAAAAADPDGLKKLRGEDSKAPPVAPKAKRISAREQMMLDNQAMLTAK